MEGVPLYLAAAAAAVLLVAAYIVVYNKLQRLRVRVEEGSAGIDVALEKRFDLLTEELEAVKKYLRHESEIYTSITEIRSGTKQDGQMLVRQECLTEEALREVDRQIREQSETMARIKARMEQSRRSGGSSARSRKRQEKREQAFQQSAAGREAASNQKMNLLAGIHHDMSMVGSGFDALAEQYPVLYSTNTMTHFQRSIADAEEHLQAARRLYNANASAYNQARASFPFSLVAALHGMERAEFYEAEANKRSFTVSFD